MCDRGGESGVDTVSTVESSFALFRYGLQIERRRSRTVRTAPVYERRRQAPLAAAGRELGIGTIDERPGSPHFECYGQNAEPKGSHAASEGGCREPEVRAAE